MNIIDSKGRYVTYLSYNQMVYSHGVFIPKRYKNDICVMCIVSKFELNDDEITSIIRIAKTALERYKWSDDRLIPEEKKLIETGFKMLHDRKISFEFFANSQRFFEEDLKFPDTLGPEWCFECKIKIVE